MKSGNWYWASKIIVRNYESNFLWKRHDIKKIFSIHYWSELFEDKYYKKTLKKT